MENSPDPYSAPPEREFPPLSAMPRQKRRWLPLVFFVAAVVTTLAAGMVFQIGFEETDANIAWNRIESVTTNPGLLLLGFPFSATLLLILMAHEMGHYLTCRYYRIDATPPYVIPAPPFIPIPGLGFLPFNPFGTFGAVIRIRSPFRDRKELFDVGIGGPLAGMVFVLPAVVYGVMHSKPFVMTGSENFVVSYGEPLLFKLAVWLLYTGDPASISLHPIGWAAWFGMLATSINLLPIGQLDGGHTVYALFGRETHRRVSFAVFLGLVILSLASWPSLGYLFFAAIIFFLGLRHPAPWDDWTPPPRNRLWPAIIGLVIFIMTFVPVPVQILEDAATSF